MYNWHVLWQDLCVWQYSIALRSCRGSSMAWGSAGHWAKFQELWEKMLKCVGREENGRFTLTTPFSLAVVENLRGKCKGEFVLSFSESVHPTVPQKKNPHWLGLGNFFHSTLNFRLKLGWKSIELRGRGNKFKSQITCIQHMIVQTNWQSYKIIALYWGSIFKIYVIT